MEFYYSDTDKDVLIIKADGGYRNFWYDSTWVRTWRNS